MRYITSNAANRIPLETQIVMWLMYDRMNGEKDYLQIFHLKSLDKDQQIIHKQENPPWCEELIYDTETPVTEKVYIIDEGEYEIMLLAEDY